MATDSAPQSCYVRIPKPKVVSRWWSAAIGAGVALFPIHNRFLTDAATTSNGTTVVFLPAIAFTMLLVGTGFFAMKHWEELKAAGIGSRWVAVPLLVLAACIAISSIGAGSVAEGMATVLLAAAFFAVYLVSRVVGVRLLEPLAVGAAVASIGILISQLWRPGWLDAGLVFEHNYDISAGYIMLGSAMLLRQPWRWMLAALAVGSLLISDSPEALLAIAACAVVVIVRHDWSRRLVYAAVIVLTIVSVYTVRVISVPVNGMPFSYLINTITGTAGVTYQSDESGTIVQIPSDLVDNGAAATEIAAVTTTDNTAVSTSESTVEHTAVDTLFVSAIGYRWLVIRAAMRNISVLGGGYSMSNFHHMTVHNVPLIIVQQLGWFGVLAGLAWITVTIVCGVRSRYKYAWLLFAVLSIFDHFTWTQMAPLFWVMAGVSVAVPMGRGGTQLFEKADYIFREPESQFDIDKTNNDKDKDKETR